MIELNDSAMDTSNGYHLGTVYEFNVDTQNGCQRPMTLMYSGDADDFTLDLADGQYAVAFQSPDLTQGVEHAVLRSDSPLWFSEHVAGVFDSGVDPLEFALCVAELMDKCGYWGQFIERIEPKRIGNTVFLLVHMGS